MAGLDPCALYELLFRTGSVIRPDELRGVERLALLICDHTRRNHGVASGAMEPNGAPNLMPESSAVDASDLHRQFTFR